MNSIEIAAVTKQYKKGAKGLDDVSFSIGTGVFGLLGHNGAGKTTLMRLITTILRPTEGTITVLGYDTMKDGDAVRRTVGYLPQELTMYNNLSVFDFVAYMARLKGIKDNKATLQMIEGVGMGEFKGRKIGQLSGGMKRRVGIAQAIVGNPRIVIVDEPTAGLDPEERVRFRGILSRYAKTDRTIILSTHIVEDIYQLCEQVAVLRGGKLFYNGSTDALMDTVKGKVKVVDVLSDEELANLQNKAIILSVAYTGEGIKARVMDEAGIFKQAPTQETLEDAYVYCMGGKNRE